MLPTLATSRLLLRPSAGADVDRLWSLWIDPDVRRFLWDDRSLSRGEVASTLEECQALNDRGLGLWIIEASAADVAPAAPVGCAALMPVSTAAHYEPRLSGLTEPLIALSPGIWGRGYAHEALTTLLEYAAGSLGLSRIAGVTDVPNVRSDRMLRRAGFKVMSEVPGPRCALRTYIFEPVNRDSS